MLTPYSSAHESWAEVESIAQVLTPKATNRADFIEECRTGIFDGAEVVYRTFDSFALTGRVDTVLLEVLPGTIRFICHNGAYLQPISAAIYRL